MSRLWSTLIVLFNYNLHIDAMYHIKTTCEYGLCLTLYGSNNTDGSSSFRSRAACEGLDQTIAAITDASVQDTVQRLLSDVPDIDDVWTAGYRRQNHVWSYMNGSDFRESVSTAGEAGAYCVFMRPGQMTSFSADQCNERNGRSYPFCQFTPTISDSCSTLSYPGFLYKDTCYYVHNQQPGDGGWYDAYTFCHTQLGGVLAYRHILDTDLMDQLAVSMSLWIGVSRYRWDWLPKLGEFLPMQYFNWAADYDESPTKGRVAISSGDFTWKNLAASTRLRHFMCAYVDETYTTSVPTTTTAVPVTTTQTTSMEQATSTASGSDVITTALYPTTARNDNKKQFPVAAVAASAAVALVAVSVLALVLTLRKKRGGVNAKPPDDAQKVGGRTPVQSITDVSSGNQGDVMTQTTKVIEYEDVTELTQTSYRHEDGGHVTGSPEVYEAITEGDGRQSSSYSPYEALTEPSHGNTTADITYEDDNEPGGVLVTLSDNPYEVPSNYVNIVDQPGVYDSLRK